MALMIKSRRIFTKPGPSFWLISLWLLGLVFGAWFSLSAGEAHFSLMRSAPTVRTSIFSLLTMLLLPFMITALAVLMDTQILIFLIGFLKGFSFSFVSVGTLLAFPAGGWLLRCLMMFADICVNPILFLFMLHCISGRKRILFFPAVSAVIYTVLAAAIDHSYISPFLAELMKI